MLHQVMILSPDGPCFASRSFSDKTVDPQLFSAMVVAREVTGEEELIDKILKDEYSDIPLRYYLQKSYNYISAAIADEEMGAEEVLSKLNQLAYEKLGKSTEVKFVDIEKLRWIERAIDLIVTKEGLVG